MSSNGQDFIPMALKKTAAEKRAEKLQKAQENITEIAEKVAPVKKMSLKNMDKLPSGISVIIPGFLYLGSGRDAYDINQLQQHRIGNIINVAREFPPSSFAEIIYHEELIDDESTYKLLPHFETSWEKLEKVREKKESILVHCAVGKSRSPAIIIAYLMKYKNLTLKQAYNLVKTARESIVINSGNLE